MDRLSNPQIIQAQKQGEGVCCYAHLPRLALITSGRSVLVELERGPFQQLSALADIGEGGFPTEVLVKCGLSEGACWDQNRRRGSA